MESDFNNGSLCLQWGGATTNGSTTLTLPLTVVHFYARLAGRSTINYTGTQTNFLCGTPDASHVTINNGGGGADWTTYLIVCVV